MQIKNTCKSIALHPNTSITHSLSFRLRAPSQCPHLAPPSPLAAWQYPRKQDSCFSIRVAKSQWDTINTSVLLGKTCCSSTCHSKGVCAIDKGSLKHLLNDGKSKKVHISTEWWKVQGGGNGDGSNKEGGRREVMVLEGKTATLELKP